KYQERRGPSPAAPCRTAMEHYVGLDVSLKLTAICIVDRTGKIEREGVVASEPETIAAFIKSYASNVVRIAADVPRHRWHQFVQDCHAFMASEQVASRAAQLGWDAIALFGCQPNYPLMYLGKAGLLWQVSGGRIIELHRDCAVIDRSVNRSQRIFYR